MTTVTASTPVGAVHDFIRQHTTRSNDMSTSTLFNVYDSNGDLQAKCVDPMIASAIVGNVLGDGATVRYQRRTIWCEGTEQIEAGESYDLASEIMWARVNVIDQEQRERADAKNQAMWAAALDRTVTAIQRSMK